MATEVKVAVVPDASAGASAQPVQAAPIDPHPRFTQLVKQHELKVFFHVGVLIWLTRAV
jgi:hypothetical protein